MSFQGQRLKQFVPNYVPKSDFLPGTKVNEVSEADRLQILRDIEEDRRKGRVLTIPPPGFNPARYSSYQVFENVNTAQRIPAIQMLNVHGYGGSRTPIRPFPPLTD